MPQNDFKFQENIFSGSVFDIYFYFTNNSLLLFERRFIMGKEQGQMEHLRPAVKDALNLLRAALKLH